MDKTKTIQISDIGEVITGNTPPRKNPEYYGDYTLFIKPTDISKDSKYTYNPEECYSEIGYEKYKKTLIPQGATCVVTIGSIGEKLTKAHTDCFINQAMNAVIPNEKYDEDYVYYVLKYNLKQLKMFDSGTASGRENVSKSAFSSININILTKKDNQIKVGKILSNYDDLIENNNKRIKILEEMAQKIYKEWFVDFRFPGHETTTFKQSNLGKIPSDWKIDLANQIAEIYIGRTPSRKDFECFTTCKKDKKWVSIKDIGHSNEYIFDTSEYLTENAIKKYNVPLIPKDTIILSFKLTVGKVTITTEEMTSNEAIAQFQIKDKELIPTNYLFLYLKNFEYNNLGNTSSIGNAINSTIVKNMPIIVPNKGVVQKFDKIIINIFNQIKNLSQQNTNLKQVRDLLLPRLISSEIDVENLNIL